MTKAKLSELLGERALGDTFPSEILELLAFVGTATLEAGDQKALAQQAPIPEAMAKSLDEMLAEILPSVVSSGPALDRWLADIEQISLARRGIAQMPAALAAAPLGAVIDRHLTRITETLVRRSDLWLHAALAEQQRSRFGDDLLPWSKIVHSVPEGGALTSVDEAVRRWVDGGLHPADAAVLQRQVREPGPLRDSYRDALRQRAARIPMRRSNPAWALDAAETITSFSGPVPIDDGLPAELLLRLPLPHLGPDRALLVWQHVAGLLWEDGVSNTLSVIPFESITRAWGDETTGEISTAFETTTLDPLDDLWQAIVCLRNIIEQEEFRDSSQNDPAAKWEAFPGRGTRGPLAGRALAQALAEVSIRDRLRNAAKAFDAGEEIDEELLRWVAHVLEARLVLSELPWASHDSQLIVLLVRLDESLSELGPALMTLEEEHYQSLVEESELDEESWWGFRSALERKSSSRFTDDALLNRSEYLWAKPGPPERQGVWDAARINFSLGVRELSKRALASAAIRAQSAPVYFADDGSLAPGEATVLLYSRDGDAGAVAKLLISHQGHDGGWRSAQLQAVARDAVRMAYEATARAVPGGLAPHPFDEYRIDIRLHEDAAILPTIDGASLGLAAALAFASLWSGRKLPSDLASSGTIRMHKTGALIGPVSSIPAKLSALATAIGGQPARVLISTEVEELPAFSEIQTIRVASLEDALRHANLDLGGVSVGTLGSIAHQKEKLARLVQHVDSQSLADYRLAGIDPWMVLGDHLRRLVHSLEREAEGVGMSELLLQGRAHAALAFLHAGDAESASTMIHPVQNKLARYPAIATLTLVVKLDSLIDQEDWGAADSNMTAIDAIYGQLSDADRTLLAGRVFGTKGRVLMHQRRLDEALPLLEQAVNNHEQHAPHEVGRSRSYLAMALRMVGRHANALAQLDRAWVELKTLTRRFSGPYFDNCLMYWHYERARLLIEMGQSELAAFHSREALAEASWRGFWPQLGILRTLSWAERRIGGHAEREAIVARMQALRSRVPSDSIRFADRLITETGGPPRRDGEVY